MRVGFVGGEKMPPAQERALRALLDSFGAVAEFHHPCRGWGDELAVRAVRDLYPRCRVVAHPERAGCHVSHAGKVLSDETRDADIHLARLCRIVTETDVLVVCPDGPESLRASPWYAVRNARYGKKPVHVLAPDTTHPTTTTQEPADGRAQRDQLDRRDVQPVAGLPAGERGV